MANIKFNGTLANSSYIFADGANWLGGIAPGAADRAIVDTALTFTFSGDGAVAQLQVTQASVAMTGTITANGSLGHELDVSNGGTFYILPGARFDGVNAGVNDDIIGEATGLQPAAFVVLEGELDADLTVLQPSGHLAVGFGSVLTGGITGNGGELYVYPVIGGAGKTVVVNNNIDLIGGTTRLDGDPSFPLEVSGVITNTATLQLAFSVTLTGALIGDGVLEVAGGLVTLNDTDSHSGGTNLLSGTLALDAPALAGGGPGSGKLAISGGTLLAAADGTITNQLAMFSSIEIAATHGQTVIFQPTSGWSLDRTGAQVTFGDSVNDGVVVWTNPSGSSVTGSGSYVVDIADGTLRLGDSNYTSLLGSGGVLRQDRHRFGDYSSCLRSVITGVPVPAIPSWLLEPLWDQFAALLTASPSRSSLARCTTLASRANTGATV